MYGSTGKLNNVISFLYEKNQSNFQETHNKRMAVNYRASCGIFNWLDFNFSTMLQHNTYTNSGVSLGDIQGMAPYEMLLNEDGSYTNVHRFYWPIMERLVPMGEFPYADWTHNPIQENKNRNLTNNQINARIQTGLTFKILDGLSWDSKVQYENFNTYNRNLYNDETFYVRDMINKSSEWNQAT
jgi:TonB-dependent starch-binding outer membrane protein SusC